MACRHAFHKDCVDRWLETGKNNCPACRSRVCHYITTTLTDSYLHSQGVSTTEARSTFVSWFTLSGSLVEWPLFRNSVFRFFFHDYALLLLLAHISRTTSLVMKSRCAFVDILVIITCCITIVLFCGSGQADMKCWYNISHRYSVLVW